MLRTAAFTCMLICFPTMMTLAQEAVAERYLEVRGASELEMRPLARATADLIEGTTKIQSIQTGADGYFSFRLEMNKEYTIEIIKDGLISKKISFNTTIPDEEKGMWMTEFSIGLVRNCDGVDYSALKEPVDIVKFDPKRREFVSDREYVNRMRPRLENILAKYDACMMDKYDAAIKKGDQAFLQKDFSLAQKAYQDALEVYPEEIYPTRQINEIKNQLNRQQKSAQQAEVQEQKKLDDSYNQAMAKASVAYTRKDYATARQYYQEALGIKPNESLPKTRMQEIDDILAKKASEESRIKAEEAQKAAAREQVEKQYEEIVGTANQLVAEKDLTKAREAYSRALAIKPGDQYAQSKISAIDNMIAAEQKAKIIAAEEGYKDAIGAANTALAQKSYALAKEYLQKALALKPGDAYATSKTAEIDNLIEEQRKAKERQEQAKNQYNQAVEEADKLFNAGKLQEARAAFKALLQVKPGDSYANQKITAIENLITAEVVNKQKQSDSAYSSAMAAGSHFLAARDFTKARESFRQALAIKPMDAPATAKLGEVDTQAAQEQERITAEQDRKRNYDETITKADQLFAQKNYTAAREAFETALKIIPGELYPRQKLDVISVFMQEQEKLAVQAQATENAYSLALTSADKYFKAKDLDKAKEEYTRAITLKPAEEFPKARIRELDNLIRIRQEEQVAARNRAEAYAAAINLGNKQLAARDYTGARVSYSEALKQMPNDKLAREQIDKINRVLSDQEKQKANEATRKEAVASAPLGELNFRTESEKQKYLDDLKKKYPSGITLEKYKEKYKETYRFIVIREDLAHEFRQVRFLTYNGVEYSFNGKPITQQYFLSQVKTRQGESYKEIEMQ